MDGWFHRNPRKKTSFEFETPFGWDLPQGFPSLDAVTYTEQHIVRIQVTVAPEHDAKPAGLGDTDNNTNANKSKGRASHFERGPHLLYCP